MPDPIISVSGLRGIIGESLTPEIAIRYATAFAEGLPSGPILISRDGRTSGPMLAASLIGGLTAMGRDVIDADIAATPTTGVLVRYHRAAGGIQISASHNPPQYNGLKLFSDEGRVIPAAAGRRVIERYQSGSPQRATVDRIGSVVNLGDAAGPLTPGPSPARGEGRSSEPLASGPFDQAHGRPSHARGEESWKPHWELLSTIVDVERIRRRKFNVLLDSAHGAGSVLARRVFDELGCTATIVGGEPDGRFDHTPEPTAENLRTILPLVISAGADVGFCQDPDADRLAVIDERGRYIGEEYTLAICVAHVLRHRPGPIAINCSTSRMSEDLAKQFGVPLVRSAVGEANVVDAMLAQKAVLGGEGSGGVIDPRVGLVRDSFVGMMLILDAMAERNVTVSQLADELPRYEIAKTQIPLPRERLAAAFATLEKHFSDAKADRLDGLRLDWPDRWFLVRPSNTEPIVRAVAESRSAAESSRLLAEAADVIRGVS